MRCISLRNLPGVFLALCAVLLISSGCSSWPELTAEEVVATRALDSGERETLATEAWNFEQGVYRINFSALYGYRGFEMPLAGIVEVDTLSPRTHLVGITDTGMKLFDIEGQVDVEVHGTTAAVEIKVNFLVEALLRFPDLAGAVGRGAWRIFIAPFPGPEDSFKHLPDRYLLRAKRAAEKVAFTLAGDGRLMAKKLTTEGDETGWSVRYSGHGDSASAPFPAQSDYSDGETGATLRLRINSVRLVQ